MTTQDNREGKRILIFLFVLSLFLLSSTSIIAENFSQQFRNDNVTISYDIDIELTFEETDYIWDVLEPDEYPINWHSANLHIPFCNVTYGLTAFSGWNFSSYKALDSYCFIADSRNYYVTGWVTGSESIYNMNISDGKIFMDSTFNAENVASGFVTVLPECSGLSKCFVTNNTVFEIKMRSSQTSGISTTARNFVLGDSTMGGSLRQPSSLRTLNVAILKDDAWDELDYCDMSDFGMVYDNTEEVVSFTGADWGTQVTGGDCDDNPIIQMEYSFDSISVVPFQPCTTAGCGSDVVAIGYNLSDFYYLKISNIGIMNFSNELPRCTFSVTEPDLCFNETGNVVPLNIECADKESNQIYYGINDYHLTRAKRVYFEDFVTGSGSNCNYDFSFFNGSNFVSSEQGVIGELQTSLVKSRLIPATRHILFKDSACTSHLGLVADGNYSIFRFGESFGFETSTLFGVSFTSDEQELIIKPTDTMIGETLFNITLNQSAGNLTITLNNIVVHNKEKALFEFLPFDANRVDIRYFINNTNNITNVDFQIVNKVGVVTTTEIVKAVVNNTISNYDGINMYQNSNEHKSGNKNYILIRPIRVTGWNYEITPEFSTTQPTIYTLGGDTKSNFGNNVLDLYVTDSQHLDDNEFQTYSQSIFISGDVECGINFNPSDEAQEVYTGLKEVESTVINMMVDLTGLSFNWWAGVFVLLYSLICLLCAFIMHFVTMGNKQIANLTFWGLELFGHLFLVFPNWMSDIVLVVFSLSFAIWLISLMTTREVTTG